MQAHPPPTFPADSMLSTLNSRRLCAPLPRQQRAAFGPAAHRAVPSATPLQVVKLKAFSKFENTTEALAGAAALTDSKLSKGLKKFLKKNAAADELAVLDAKLGGLIKEKLGIQCIWRCARRRRAARMLPLLAVLG